MVLLLIQDFFIYQVLSQVWTMPFMEYSMQMQHCRRPATDGAYLSSFSRIQVIQNKRPWCSAAAYVTAGFREPNYQG